jgi:hypothetical protein
MNATWKDRLRLAIVAAGMVVALIVLARFCA